VKSLLSSAPPDAYPRPWRRRTSSKYFRISSTVIVFRFYRRASEAVIAFVLPVNVT
jgi:hypothetical protein